MFEQFDVDGSGECDLQEFEDVIADRPHLRSCIVTACLRAWVEAAAICLAGTYDHESCTHPGCFS